MSESPREGRTKKLLLGAAAFGVGFPLFAGLHNLLYALARMTDIAVVSGGVGFLSAACFVAAVVVCPAGVVICLVAALLDPLTRGWKSGPRLIVVVLAPLLAAGAALTILNDALTISYRERDDEAGFNGSFEVVKSGYPANWYFYRRPLDDGDLELSLDPTELVDGTQSLKLLVHRADLEEQRKPGLFQVVDAETGRSYRVSFWLRNEGAQVRLLIDSEQPESREPRRPIEEIIDSDATAGWHEFAYTYTVPDHYDNIRFELEVVAPGTVWIDGVTIEPVLGSFLPPTAHRRSGRYFALVACG